MNVMYIFVTSAIGMFEQQTRVLTPMNFRSQLNTSEVLTFDAMSARTHFCIYRVI